MVKLTPREIIANTLEKSFYMLTYDELAADLLSALTAAGYRLVGPGELGAETVERCAKVAARHNGISPRDSRDIAAAIRALSQEAKP